MEQICYVVHEPDNVATAMADIEAGKVELTGETGNAGSGLTALQPVPFGHKIALRDLDEGSRWSNMVFLSELPRKK